MKSFKHHKPALQQIWTGRVDSSEDQKQFRWHQKVHCTTDAKSSIVLTGFACDEGVRRNMGRVGAASGPAQIRKHLASLAWHFNPKTTVTDIGNIVCTDGHLEDARSEYTELLTALYSQKNFVIGLGGGHEIAQPHGLAIYQAFPKARIGIVNFDAHYDLRPLNDGLPHSGSPFLELSEHCRASKRKFQYCCVGLQPLANTRSLFETAGKLGVSSITAQELRANSNACLTRIRRFIKSCDRIYLTICLDVLGQAYAPGVSAPSPLGLTPHELLSGIETVMKSGKVAGLDIAELAPNLDHDDMTAKLAAQIVAHCAGYSQTQTKHPAAKSRASD